MSECVISEIKTDGHAPVIVNFQNGQLLAGVESELNVQVFRKKHEKKTKLATIATKSILYLGEITGDHNDASNVYNNYLLIRNKKTNKARLIAVDHATLKPHMAKKSRSHLAQQPQQLNNTRLESLVELNKQFGSKRTKRRTEQQERMKMDVETVREQLEETVANVKISETDHSLMMGGGGGNTTMDGSTYRPPCNRDATTKEDVYVVSEIVPDVVLDSFADEAAEAYSGNNDKLQPFIKEQLVKLANQHGSSSLEGPDNIQEKYQLLLYVNYLISFIGTPAKFINRKFVACPTSSEADQFILENFTVKSNTGRTRPVSMRDKTLCHILVLATIALNYSMNVDQLSKDVKIGVKKLQEVARVLGLTVQGSNVMLKLPLPPPSSGFRKRKN